jgi:hypothetical protein
MGTNYLDRYLSVTSVAGAGELISAPNAKASYVLVDVMASAAMTLKETDNSGDVIAHFPAGHTGLTAPIKVTAGKAIYSTTGNVSVTYHIEYDKTHGEKS